MFVPETVKNIIFDLGGVIIDLRRENAVAALERLGLSDADQLLGLYRQEEPFLGLETGRLTVAEFFEIIRQKCPGATDVEITDAFNQFLIGIPAERLQRLLDLRKRGYRVFALSNTNPVMYNSWIAAHFREAGLTVNDYFEGIVTSFQELCCKPDRQIFEIILRRYNLNPSETLMLDDSEVNCEAAASVGMQTFRVGKEKDNDVLAATAPFIA